MVGLLLVLNLAVLLWLVFEVRTLRGILGKVELTPSSSSSTNLTDPQTEESSDPAAAVLDLPPSVQPFSFEDEAIARKTLSLARQGVAAAQCSLGKLYEKGLGLIPDQIQAVYWYEAAAKQGHAEALFLLGQCRLEGNGVEKDEHEAESLFRRSAATGWAESQYRLAQLLAGPGRSEKELTEARGWLDKAAQQGHLGARRAWADLRSINSSFRDDLPTPRETTVAPTLPQVASIRNENRESPDSQSDGNRSTGIPEAGKAQPFHPSKTFSNLFRNTFSEPLKVGAFIVVWIIFLVTFLFFLCATFDGL